MLVMPRDRLLTSESSHRTNRIHIPLVFEHNDQTETQRTLLRLTSKIESIKFYTSLKLA